jgi:hypothetical protein
MNDVSLVSAARRGQLPNASESDGRRPAGGTAGAGRSTDRSRRIGYYLVHDTQLLEYRTLQYARVMGRLIEKNRPLIFNLRRRGWAGIWRRTSLGDVGRPECGLNGFGLGEIETTEQERKKTRLHIRPAFRQANIIATIFNSSVACWRPSAKASCGMAIGDPKRPAIVDDRSVQRFRPERSQIQRHARRAR